MIETEQTEEEKTAAKKIINDEKNKKIARKSSWLYEMLEENELDKHEKKEFLRNLMKDFQAEQLELLQAQKV